MQRRTVLTLIGGGVIAATTAATAGFLATRTPSRAIAPWQSASLYTEPRRRALSYAILAPNPHNRQPWLVDLSTPDEITLFVDTEKMLPHTDPLNRQITIGLGCFLELLVMAAAEGGYRCTADLFPDGHDDQRLDARPVARIRLAEDAGISPDPLFAHVLERRSLKEVFDVNRPVDQSVLDAIVAAATHGGLAGASNDMETVTALRDLTHRALDIEVETPRTYKESVDLFRLGKGEIEASPDGIDFGGPVFDSLVLLGQMSRAAALDKTSMVFTEGKTVVFANADTAMAHLWLTTSGNTRIDQINAGRDWVRLNLAATGQGVGLHPLSQALQEFPEMADCYEEAHMRLAPQGGTVQMLARLGYAPSSAPSPRWPLEAKIIAES